jgi:hypothetical protein
VTATPPGVSAPLARVVAALGQAGCRRGGPRGDWQCPAHQDHTPSLSVHQGHDGRVLLHCHAGCAPEQVAAALGLTMRDLFPEPDHDQAEDDWTPRGPAIATYRYTAEAGRLLFAVCRTTDKQFPQWRPDPSAKGGRRWSLKDKATGKPAVRLVLYRLPKVLRAAAQGATVYVVEGEKDVHAVEAAGGVATCNPGGAGPGRWRQEYAAALVGASLVVVVADRDGPDPKRPANSYKGQRHARRIARSLRARGIPVRLVMAAAGKDAADHLAAGHGLDDFLPLPDDDTRSPAGTDPDRLELAADGQARDTAGGPPPADSRAGGRDQDGASTATELVALATDRYELAMSATGEPFAVARAGHGPYLAGMLRGGQASLRAELAAGYARKTGRVPASSALADALNVLEGIAIDRPPVPLALRVARHQAGLVLDLGDPAGRVVVLTSGGWEVAERSPVLFRRTKLTGILPEPERGGRLEALRELGLVNLSESTWPLAVAWLVAALVPDIAHPIPLLVGEQGTGKSTTARLLSRLVDPSPAELRSAPRDLEQWAVAAAGSWLVVLDNISGIPDWLSDALCRAVTGDGMVRRRLYENDDLSVLAFRRVVALTSIDPGALRGDLADRIVLFDLERFQHRGEELHLDQAFHAAWPHLLGGLLDLACQVLAALPTVHVDHPPRLADFARILAATDQVLGTRALETYRALSSRISADVVEADPVAEAVRKLATTTGTWQGTAGELLGKLTADLGDQRPPTRLAGHPPWHGCRAHPGRARATGCRRAGRAGRAPRASAAALLVAVGRRRRPTARRPAGRPVAARGPPRQSRRRESTVRTARTARRRPTAQLTGRGRRGWWCGRSADVRAPHHATVRIGSADGCRPGHATVRRSSASRQRRTSRSARACGRCGRCGRFQPPLLPPLLESRGGKPRQSAPPGRPRVDVGPQRRPPARPRPRPIHPPPRHRPTQRPRPLPREVTMQWAR